MLAPIGNAAKLDNNILSIQQMQSAPMTMEFRHPLNSGWDTPFATDRSGLNIYQLSFYLWNFNWLAQANYDYLIAAVPVLKDTNNIPFCVLTFTSEGINPLSWPNIATGLNAGMYVNGATFTKLSAPSLGLSSLPALFLSDPLLCTINADPGDSFVMAEMETVPHTVPYYNATNPPSIAPPAKIQRTDGSAGITVTSPSARLRLGTFIR